MNRVISSTWQFLAVCLAIGAVGGCAGAIPKGDTPADPAVPNTVETRIHLDPRFTPTIGGDFYPEEARVRNAQGFCVVRVYVDAEGYCRATQLVHSTGFPTLDAAHLAGFSGGRFRPATRDGIPVTSWSNIPTIWRLMGRPDLKPTAWNQKQPPVPTIDKN